MLQPKVSQIVYFQIKDEVTEEPIEYKTRIADENEETLSLEIPINVKTGRMKVLRAGSILSAYFMNEAGVKHFFETYVIKAENTQVPLFIVARPSEDAMKSIQRRNYFRIDIEVDIALQTENGKRYVFKTADIGGGGTSFLVKGGTPSFASGQKLNCWLLLPHRNGSIEHSQFVGEVLREKELENGNTIVMLKFEAIAEPERQRVIRFLFEKQIQFRDR